MAPGLQKFEVILENPDNIFSPGETISGQVLVVLSRTKSIRGLKVSVHGMAEVGWSRVTGTSGQMTSYLNKEEYIKHQFYLLGGVHGSENVEMQTGEHVLLFNCSLPTNIPSSFEHKNGRISYAIHAVLERPWKFDHQTVTSFKNVIDDEEHKSFCCFPCFKMGSMKVHVYVPTSGFAVGQTIEAKIDISNNSMLVDVTTVELQLQQIIKVIGHSTINQLLKFNNQGHTKKSSEIVQKTEQFGPFDKNAEIVIGLKVPEVPCSNLVHCNIINVLYRLNIHISISNCQGALEKSYPIVIGTKSSSSQLVRNDFADSAANQISSP